MYLKNKISFMKSVDGEFFGFRQGEGQEQLLSPPKVAVSARNSKAGEMSC